MKGYAFDIESATLQNSDYRRVLFTRRRMRSRVLALWSDQRKQICAGRAAV